MYRYIGDRYRYIHIYRSYRDSIYTIALWRYTICGISDISIDIQMGDTYGIYYQDIYDMESYTYIYTLYRYYIHIDIYTSYVYKQWGR